ncbi:hypothetical protein Tco_1488408 [Tanacetum coccineum]
MGLMSPSHSLTHPSLSIKPLPQSTLAKWKELIGDVTCEREEMEGQDEEKKDGSSSFGLGVSFGVGWLLRLQEVFRAVGQLIG